MTTHNIDFIKLLVVYEKPRMRQCIQRCFQDIVQVPTALIRRLCSNFYCQPSGQVLFQPLLANNKCHIPAITLTDF